MRVTYVLVATSWISVVAGIQAAANSTRKHLSRSPVERWADRDLVHSPNAAPTSAHPLASLAAISANATASDSATVSVNAMLTTTLEVFPTTKQGDPNAARCVQNCTFQQVVSEYGAWQQCQTMATVVVGRIVYIVDNNTNATKTSTSYSAQVTFRANGTLVTSAVSDIIANGSQILTRKDVNAAGTVTARAMNGDIMWVPTEVSGFGTIY
jgi:hypothetical protein